MRIQKAHSTINIRKVSAPPDSRVEKSTSGYIAESAKSISGHSKLGHLATWATQLTHAATCYTTVTDLGFSGNLKLNGALFTKKTKHPFKGMLDLFWM